MYSVCEKEAMPTGEKLNKELSPQEIAELEAAKIAAEALRAITIRGGSEVEVVLSDEPDHAMRFRIIQNNRDKKKEAAIKELSTESALGQAILGRVQGEEVDYPAIDSEGISAEIISVDNTNNDH